MTVPRELLEAYAVEYLDPDGECAHDCDDDRGNAAPKAFAAVRAVLDLHQPTALGGLLVCGRCRYDTGEPEPWPCPTVHAIMTALEVAG